MKKIVIAILVVLVVLWGVMFFIDYSRCSHLKEPIFVVAGVTADDGGSGIYYGLGYKVKMEKRILPEYGPTLLKIDMYLFDMFIVGAVAETNIDDIKEDNKKTEEKYEFVATIIEAYDSSILVEPEEGTNERKSSDKISINITRPTTGTNDFYIVGNKVKISYNGVIMESYPAQIVATKIELVI